MCLPNGRPGMRKFAGCWGMTAYEHTSDGSCTDGGISVETCQ